MARYFFNIRSGGDYVVDDDGRTVPRSKPPERERSGAHESCCRSYTTPGVRPKRLHSRSRTSLGVCACASRSPWPRGARPTLEWARCADSAGLTQGSGPATVKWVVPTREQTKAKELR